MVAKPRLCHVSVATVLPGSLTGRKRSNLQRIDNLILGQGRSPMLVD